MPQLLQPGVPTLIDPPTPRHAAPVWIRAFAVVAALAAVVAAVVLATAAADVRDSLVDLRHRTAPQVTGTEDLNQVLADMDAQLANVLLAGDEPSLADVRTAALDTFEKDRDRASADLQQAATAVGDDKDAQDIVRSVLAEFGRYQSLAAQAIQLNDQQHNGAGHPSADVLSLQRRATDSMRVASTTAHDLTRTNSARLNQSYQDAQGAAVAASLWLAVIGLVLIGGLVGLQIVLRVRMRRRLNPAVLAATLLAGWLVFGGITLLNDESAHLRGAKEDAFDSLIALRQARAVSYDANADESRYLLDPLRADKYDSYFRDKSEQVLDLHLNAGWGQQRYNDSLNDAVRVYQTNHSEVRFAGFLGTAIKNITFTGEQEAADSVLSTYEQYERDDVFDRGKATQRDLLGAITFCVESSRGSSNYDFYRYDKALVHLIDINQRAFDSHVAAGDSAVGGWMGVLPYGGAALIIVLVAVGVWPRLAEYR